MCYTYDELSRVTKRTIKDLNDTVLSEESFSYDMAGNITDAPYSCFAYDTNNRLVTFNGQSVSYDTDGNMTYGNNTCCEYDSLNRLISAGAHDYIYNAENVRIRNLCEDEDTVYTYDTNCKLSQLLMKTTNNAVTKYVYGLGLIGEEVSGAFKTYHFDCRGSTIAITDASGNITDTFAYDTYGKRTVLSGTSDVIFGYNGRDGVVTDDNGLIYMRARYYSPEMRRFVNADIIAGKLNNAVTLNRYAYANANPAMFVDPTGLFGLFTALAAVAVVGISMLIGGSTKRGTSSSSGSVSTSGASRTPRSDTGTSRNRGRTYTREDAEIAAMSGANIPSGRIVNPSNNPSSFDDSNGEILDKDEYYGVDDTGDKQPANQITAKEMEQMRIAAIQKAAEEARDKTIEWGASKFDDMAGFGNLIVPDRTPPSVYIKGATPVISAVTTAYDVLNGMNKNYQNGESYLEIGTDAVLDVGSALIPVGVQVGTKWAVTKIGATVGTTVSPGVGTAIGTVVGFLAGIAYDIWGKPALDDRF